MQIPKVLGVILLLVILSAPPCLAAENTVPLAGTGFLGEQGLDMTATGVTSGSPIFWFGPGGSISSVPAATLTGQSYLPEPYTLGPSPH